MVMVMTSAKKQMQNYVNTNSYQRIRAGTTYTITNNSLDFLINVHYLWYLSNTNLNK